jgi:serine/threonine-protein kinase
MQRGAFVGPEEVSQFVRNVFNERIAKREAHLAWAAEVTSSINIDELRAQGRGGDVVEAVDKKKDDKSHSAKSQSAVQPMAKGASGLPAPNERSSVSGLLASDSLMDDDEDIPTTVATREVMEKAAAAGAMRMPGPADLRTGPKPAAGMPAYSQPGGRDERTAALPSGLGAEEVDDLNSTIAMPANSKILDPGPPKNFGQPPKPNSGFGGYSPPAQSQPQGYGGQQQGFGGQPPPSNQPNYGFAPQPTPSYPPPQQHQGQPTAAFPSVPPSGPTPHQQQQMAQAMYGQRSGQSQIETAMSLPRPDPAQLWMAQQQAGAHQQKKNTGVLILVIALVALSIIGIGVLVFFKLKAQAPVPTKADAVVAPSAVVPAATTLAAVATPAPTTAPSPAATTTDAPQATTPPPSGPAPAGPGKTPTAATTTPPAATASAAAAGSDPGFLTIVCNPFCDDVLDNGRSLGPSPIVHLSVKPGSHRVTLKKGTMSKTVSVIVVSGQVTAQRVSMK